MTLVLAISTRTGILLAGDAAVNGRIETGRVKVFPIDNRFAMASYGGYAGTPGVPDVMDSFEVPLGIDTSEVVRLLMKRFDLPRESNTMRMLVTGRDGQVWRVTEERAKVEQLTAGAPGIWCGTHVDIGGEDPTALPNWLGGEPSAVAAQLNRLSATNLAMTLVAAAEVARRTAGNTDLAGWSKPVWLPRS